MEETVQAAFSGSEEDFSLVTGIICHACLANLGFFSKHKAMYTTEFVQDILASLKAANGIPNIDQRQSNSTTLHDVVVAKAAICRDNFLTLGSFIKSGFPASSVASMKKMAGGTHYDTAGTNWTDASTMNSMVLSFIPLYSTELAKGGMLPPFIETCTQGSDDFDKSLTDWNENRGVAEGQTQSRVQALNDVYTRLKGVMDDGKYLFRKDAAARKQFTYSAVLKKVTVNRRSGFRMEVIDGVKKIALSTASVSFVEGDWAFSANKKGIIYAKIPAGNFTAIITAPGYTPVEVKLTSDQGVVHRETISLSAAGEKKNIA